MTKLKGFKVYQDESGELVTGRVFAVTSDGKLLIEKNGHYIEIPNDGRLRVRYGDDGNLERW